MKRMLRASVLSIDRIMAAGYLSPAAYYAAGPGKRLCELDPALCRNFPGPVRKELLRLVNDEDVCLRLYFLERLDASLESGSGMPAELLDRLLEDGRSDGAADFVSAMGREAFLKGCVFVSERLDGPHLDARLVSFVRRYEMEFGEWVLSTAGRKAGRKGKTKGKNRPGSFSPLREPTFFDVPGTETFVPAPEKAEDAPSLKDVMGRNKYALLLAKYETLREKTSTRARNVMRGYKGDFIEDFVHGNGIPRLLPGTGTKTASEIGAVIAELRDGIPAIMKMPEEETEKPVRGQSSAGDGDGTPSLKDFMGRNRYALLLAKYETLREKTSTRARNVMRGYKGDFIEDFVHGNGIPRLLPGTGTKTASEIGAVIAELRDGIPAIMKMPEEETEKPVRGQSSAGDGGGTPSLKDSLGRDRYALLVCKFGGMVEKASARVRHALEAYKGDFIEDYVLDNGTGDRNRDPKNIGKIGKCSAGEMDRIIETLRREIAALRAMPEEEVCAEREKALYGEDIVDGSALQFKKDNGHLPMLRLLERHLENGKKEGPLGKGAGSKKDGREKRALRILDMTAPFFSGAAVRTIEDAARETGLTRERVKQITEKEAGRLSTDAEAWGALLSDASAWGYLTEKLKGRDVICPGDLEEYLKAEGCRLNAEYALCALSLLLKDEYAVRGKSFFRTRLRNSARIPVKWKNTYLVSKSAAENFDFDGFMKFVGGREHELVRDAGVSVRDLVNGYTGAAEGNAGTRPGEALYRAARAVLAAETGKETNPTGRFTLEGKRKTTGREFIRGLLEENGAPMRIGEVYRRLEEKFPGKYKSEASVAHIVMNDWEMGRLRYTDLVGLKRWEGVEFGSIRDIAERYLSRAGSPRAMTDIINHVRLFKPNATENSIRTSVAGGKKFVKAGNLWRLRTDADGE